MHIWIISLFIYIGVHLVLGYPSSPKVTNTGARQSTTGGRAVGTGQRLHSGRETQAAASIQGPERRRRWSCRRTCELRAVHARGLNAWPSGTANINSYF